jgi:hypothetical protein
MRRSMTWLLAAVLLAALGCGPSDKDRGKNSDKDKPRSANAG